MTAIIEKDANPGEAQPVDTTLLRRLKDHLSGDSEWIDYLDQHVSHPPFSVTVHLGVFVEPFLQYIIEGKKTIESRFSINHCAPFGVAGAGDILLLKVAGGPVVGVCRLQNVWSYEIDPESISELRAQFSIAMCAEDPEFWEERSTANCATLMQIEGVRKIEPIVVDKRDRRGWVVVERKSRQLLLWTD